MCSQSDRLRGRITLPTLANFVAICKNIGGRTNEERQRGSWWSAQVGTRCLDAKDISVREHTNLTEDPIGRLADCSVMRNKKRCKLQTETAIEVEAEDKLRWLRRLDGEHEWESLDDYRVCGCCGRTFSGRQAQLVAGTRGFGPVRFVCPTPNCMSKPADWRYPHERRAARQNSPPRDSHGRTLSASNMRDIF